MGQKTVLHDKHVEYGGKIVDFAGWEMPVQYPAGIIAEHAACREGAALFGGLRLRCAHDPKWKAPMPTETQFQIGMENYDYDDSRFADETTSYAELRSRWGWDLEKTDWSVFFDLAAGWAETDAASSRDDSYFYVTPAVYFEYPRGSGGLTLGSRSYRGGRWLVRR